MPPRMRPHSCASASPRRRRSSASCSNLHARLITRVRNASEGMIKAIADEVDRRAAPTRTYFASAAQTYGKPAQAMVYNSVV